MITPAKTARPRPLGRAIGAAVGAACELSPLLGIPAALTVPLRTPRPSRTTLRTGLGVLESAIVDRQGRLFFTSQTWNGRHGAVLRMDTPDAAPIEVAGGITSPGGLAFDNGGRLIVGFGDSVPGGLIGNRFGLAGLLLVEPNSGERETWITGLGMANGVARAPDGTIFASNDVGTHIDRVDVHGKVERRWARVPSANGLVIDRAGRYVYASQTFAPTGAAIKRVDVKTPADVTTHARPGAVCARGRHRRARHRRRRPALRRRERRRPDLVCRARRPDRGPRPRVEVPQRGCDRARRFGLPRRQPLRGHIPRRRGRARRRRWVGSTFDPVSPSVP
jgi:hypothetical protein